MEKIKIKLNKVGLRGFKKGSTIYIDPTDLYWKRRLEEAKNTDVITILHDDEPVKKPKSVKSKETN